MTKRMIIMLVLVGLLFGGIFGFQAFKGKMIKKFMTSQGIPPQTVSAIKAENSPWLHQFRAIGSLQAVRGTDLAPEVSGLVAKISFVSGQEVKAGTPLLELDASADLAKLQALKATAELAQKTYQRDRLQFQERAVSQATLDVDMAAVKTAEAAPNTAATRLFHGSGIAKRFGHVPATSPCRSRSATAPPTVSASVSISALSSGGTVQPVSVRRNTTDATRDPLRGFSIRPSYHRKRGFFYADLRRATNARNASGET